MDMLLETHQTPDELPHIDLQCSERLASRYLPKVLCGCFLERSWTRSIGSLFLIYELSCCAEFESSPMGTSDLHRNHCSYCFKSYQQLLHSTIPDGLPRLFCVNNTDHNAMSAAYRALAWYQETNVKPAEMSPFLLGISSLEAL